MMKIGLILAIMTTVINYQLDNKLSMIIDQISNQYGYSVDSFIRLKQIFRLQKYVLLLLEYKNSLFSVYLDENDDKYLLINRINSSTQLFSLPPPILNTHRNSKTKYISQKMKVAQLERLKPKKNYDQNYNINRNSKINKNMKNYNDGRQLIDRVQDESRNRKSMEYYNGLELIEKEGLQEFIKKQEYILNEDNWEQKKKLKMVYRIGRMDQQFEPKIKLDQIIGIRQQLDQKTDIVKNEQIQLDVELKDGLVFRLYFDLHFERGSWNIIVPCKEQFQKREIFGVQRQKVKNGDVEISSMISGWDNLEGMKQIELRLDNIERLRLRNQTVYQLEHQKDKVMLWVECELDKSVSERLISKILKLDDTSDIEYKLDRLPKDVEVYRIIIDQDCFGVIRQNDKDRMEIEKEVRGRDIGVEYISSIEDWLDKGVDYII